MTPEKKAIITEGYQEHALYDHNDYYVKETPHSVQEKKKVVKQRYEQTDDDVADQRRITTGSDAEEGTA